MSLKDKLSKVNVGKIAADGAARRKDGHAPEAQKTAIGFHVDSIYSDRKIAEDNQKLRSELDAFKDSELTKSLDPSFIKASHWANRSEDSFKSKEFESLKLEIESAGGNVQAIKVRPIEGGPDKYEIVFGHRRHRACLELGLPVLALIESVSDAELFTQMDRENRQRADLRPYEQGLMYARALDDGLFVSLRKLAETVGIEPGTVSKAVSLARLPVNILSAFQSPLDIQFRWATQLTAAIQKDPDSVLSRASELSKLSPKPAAAEVLKRLLGESKSAYKPFEIKGSHGRTGKFSYDSLNRAARLDLSGIDEALFERVKDAVAKLVA